MACFCKKLKFQLLFVSILIYFSAYLLINIGFLFWTAGPAQDIIRQFLALSISVVFALSSYYDLTLHYGFFKLIKSEASDS